MKLQLSHKEETESAENTENTEKFENTIKEISIFTLAVDNLQFNCDQCNKTNSSEKGLQQHLWMKQNSSEDFRYYHFDHCSLVYEKKYLKDKKKCEEGNWKSNMENVPKINIWDLDSKYRTTTDHTKRHIKIHTMKNPYHCCLCAKKSISRSQLEKI